MEYKKYIIFALIVLVIVFLLYLLLKKKITFLIVGLTKKGRVQRKILKECKLNDFLTMSDIHFPIENGETRDIDTLIFGNKYIYIVKIVKEAGTVVIDIDDLKWRIIFKNKRLRHLDNPLIENRRRIDRILAVVPGIEKSDFKSIVAFTKTCDFDPVNHNNNEFILKEDDIVKAIVEIEKKSNDDIFAPEDVERYANAFYYYSMEAEKKLKEYKKNAKSRKV